jgi:hypothetical protein
MDVLPNTLQYFIETHEMMTATIVMVVVIYPPSRTV